MREMRHLGDLILAVHAAWVVFNVGAPILAVRRPAWRIVHLCSLGLTLLFAVTMGICPLTILENRLWLAAEPGSAYAGSFLHHYLMKIVYWDAPQSVLTGLAVFWTIFWSGTYAFLWRRESGPSAQAPRKGV